MFQLHPYRRRPGKFLERAALLLERGAAPGVEEPLAAAMGRALLASRQALGLSPYVTQVAGALGLVAGHAVEMKTGEGKTLAIFLAAASVAQMGRKVTVLTSNDYLSQRDATELSAAYRACGIEVGVVQPQSTEAEKHAAYACPVVYASWREAAFDHLRDGLRRRPWATVQGKRDFALIDELDAALIDQAMVPFNIGGGRDAADADGLMRADDAVAGLVPERDYVREGAATALTPTGWQRVEQALLRSGALASGERLFEREDASLEHRVLNAVMAHTVLERDRDYLVQSERVLLLDPTTGRIANGRRWGQGLQQAVERKERVPLSPQPVTLATTTAAGFLRHFSGFAGTSATLESCAEELYERFGLPTLALPTNEPSARRDLPDRSFPSDAARRDAIVAEVARQQRLGRPVLVGTDSVAEAGVLSGALSRAGVAFTTLTARDEASEATLVADAGAPGRVTVATQLAGRGTDIVLGGVTGDRAAARAQVLGAGGLLVVLAGRGASRRHDDQWRGRSGRRGEPGETQAFVSAGDALVRDASDLSIDDAQRRAERRQADARRESHELDLVIDAQRRAFAAMREEVLWGASSHDSAACAAWWRASGGPSREHFVAADESDQWWSNVVEAGVLRWARESNAGGAPTIKELAPELLAHYGVAVRIAHLDGATRPLRLAAQLVRLGMLRLAQLSRASLASAIAGDRAVDGLVEQQARHWLDARFRASRPRHVLRLARVLALRAYDAAWASFLAQLPTLMDRARTEATGRTSPAQTLQRLAHGVLTAELNDASRHVGRALLATPGQITRAHVDATALRWLREGRGPLGDHVES